MGKFLQRLHILQPATGMGGNDVVGEILLESFFFGHPVKQFPKLEQTFTARFSHAVQYIIQAVFRCHLHLAGYMVSYHIPKIVQSVFPVCQDHIVANT